MLGAVVLLTAAVAVHDGVRRSAGALTTGAITNMQLGAVAKTTTASVTLTVPAASTAGTLLVATLVSNDKTGSFTVPTGWTSAVHLTQTNAEAEVLYYANNPGGITSVTFTNAGGTSTAGQLSEWRGVLASSPIDKTGTKSATLANSVAPSAGTTTTAGELAVTSTAQYIALASTATYTPGTGWTNLGNSGATSSSYQYTADYRTGVPAGSVSETISSSATGTLSAVIATFKPTTCTGGGLTMTPLPSSVAFPGVTLNGLDQTATASTVLSPSDMSGTAAGWNVAATSTTFTNGAGKTLPTTATTVTGGTATYAPGNCDPPTNSIAYPVTLPAAATAPTAVKVYNAAAATGGGPQTLTLSFQLAVPASAYIGTYSSTWTFSISSGP
jgi:hypothetical protein